MASIRKFLDLSTAHLDQPSKDVLDRAADLDPLNSFGPPVSKGIYGWFMFAPEEMDEYADDELTPALRKISIYARLHDCAYVMFDADGPVDDNLPILEDVEGGA